MYVRVLPGECAPDTFLRHTPWQLQSSTCTTVTAFDNGCCECIYGFARANAARADRIAQLSFRTFAKPRDCLVCQLNFYSFVTTFSVMLTV